MKIKLAAMVMAIAFMSSCSTEENDLPSVTKTAISNAPTGEDPAVPSTSYRKIINYGQRNMDCVSSGGSCLADVDVSPGMHEPVDYIIANGGHEAFTTYEDDFTSVIPANIYNAVLDGSLAVSVIGDNTENTRYLSFTNSSGEVTRVIPFIFGE